MVRPTKIFRRRGTVVPGWADSKADGEALAPGASRRRVLQAASLGAVAVASGGAGTALSALLNDQRSPTFRVSPRPETETGAYSCQVAWRAAPSAKLAAITFDDGPDPRWTPQVLDILATADARATFFEMGDAVAKHPELTASVAAAGHEVASHAIGHKDVTRLTSEELRADLTTTSDAIENACGRRPTLFRPPYGRIDAPGLFACAELGLQVVLWSHHLPGKSALSHWRHNVATASPGMILLCHDGRGDPTHGLMQAVELTVASLSSEGFDLVTISTLLAS